MRVINYIVLHCTATQPEAKVESIQRYWRDVKKWNSPGYHFLIDKAGKAHALQPIEKPSNGVQGHNANSIHISYIGGIDKKGAPKDTRTPEQLKTMAMLVFKHKALFPKALILGHRDFAGVKKACPSFDVSTWIKSLTNS